MKLYWILVWSFLHESTCMLNEDCTVEATYIITGISRKNFTLKMISNISLFINCWWDHANRRKTGQIQIVSAESSTFTGYQNDYLVCDRFESQPFDQDQRRIYKESFLLYDYLIEYEELFLVIEFLLRILHSLYDLAFSRKYLCTSEYCSTVLSKTISSKFI